MARLKFNIKKAVAPRTSFAIIRQEEGMPALTIRDERIEAVNRQFREGVAFDVCLSQIQDIKTELLKEEQRKRPQRVRLRENFDLFERFWKAHYLNRDLVDVKSARNDFLRAVEALGNTPLLTAPQEDLQSVVDKKWKKQKHRRIVERLNQILKWARPAVHLRKARPTFETPKHLSLAEFKKLLASLEDPALKALYELAFFSGLREGELMALTPKSRRGQVIDVIHQIDRDGGRRDTKSRRARKAYLLPEGVEAFSVWVRVEDKEQYRGSHSLKAACQRLFKDPLKHCTIHSLRHSYAIYLLSRGASMSHIAQSLGNSVVVCQQHYAGFTLTEDNIETLSRIIKASSGSGR